MHGFPEIRRRLGGLSRWAVLAVALVAGLAGLRGAETIPPVPARHFNDYAGMVPAETARALDAELAQFERDTSTQIVVALYPRMASASSVEDYTVRVAQAWKVGRASRNNGAVLFVFAEQRQIYIQTGYGLEPAMPDAIAKRIIEEVMVPRFRAGDFAAGVTEGARAMMAAVRGEFQGTGRTGAEGSGGGGGGGLPVPALIFFAFLVVLILSNRRRHQVYGPRGRRGYWMGGPTLPMGGGGFGGFRGGGGGGFSGGGGSFGGGGAGGRW